MITGDDVTWHYLTVKIFFALLRGITNYFHSFRIENKLQKHEKFCMNHDYCDIE